MPTNPRGSVVDARLDDLAGELIAMDSVLERLRGAERLTSKTAIGLIDAHGGLMQSNHRNVGVYFARCRRALNQGAVDAVTATRLTRDVILEVDAVLASSRRIIDEIRELRPRVTGRRDILVAVGGGDAA